MCLYLELSLSSERTFLCSQNTVADYSLESHLRDREVFGSGARSHCRRAKAVMDFERTADDELGFRKHDVIMIISQTDEHCWTGELNGLRGWFPARFAELLDERGKEVRS